MLALKIHASALLPAMVGTIAVLAQPTVEVASRLAAPNVAARTSWMADNGNGTFTNPLFYDEFSGSDTIRVDDDYYLTGNTMHTMPGLPALHSRDLVNREFVAYAVQKLDLGPEYRLQGGERYEQGIWAPCFRYHKGTFYIFANVNGRKTQLFRVLDRGQGCIALQAEDGAGFGKVTGTGEAGDLKLIQRAARTAATFLWTQTEAGDILLLSLLTHRYLAVESWANNLTSATARGIAPDRKNGASFIWTEAQAE